jgi:putative endopeptidase
MRSAASAFIIAIFLGADAVAQDAAVRPWGVDISGRDLTAHPGDDFYRYANGKYLDALEIPPHRSTYGTFDQTYENVEREMLSILEGRRTAGATTNTEKLENFYRSFMNEGRIEALGFEPISDLLDSIRSADTQELIARDMGEGQADFRSSVFDVEVRPDLRNSGIYTLYLSQASLGLPNRDYYINEEFREQRELYKSYIERILSLIGWSDPEGSSDAVLAFESALANEHWTVAESRQVEKTYNPRPIRDLATLTGDFAWDAWADGAGVSHLETVVVVQDTAVPKIAAVVAQTPVSTLQAWQAFRTVNNAAPYLSSAFTEARFNFRAQALSGQQQLPARSDRGVALVNALLGDAMGREYVSRRFSEDAKAAVSEMVDNLIEAMRRRITTVDWMGEATKAEALTKLAKMRVQIGYPARWRDYDDVTITDDDLMANINSASASDWSYNLRKVGQAVDKEEFGLGAQTASAGYIRATNTIIFPAAILQPPFFDVYADPVVNYGSIGAVIGHEMTHAFDDQGRRFDSEGQLRDWWSEEDGRGFEARAATLVDHYNAVTPLPGVSLNGRQTLGENIADLGGLLVALDAYKLSLQGRPETVVDGLSADERFYLAWAQVWREKIRDQELRRRISTNRHPPAQSRATETVRNIDSWYAAFDVTPDRQLYRAPEDRARIW